MRMERLHRRRANADASNLAVFHVGAPGKAKPLGFIPVGWYPTAVRYNPVDRRVYVANGKGTSPRANRHGPQPLLLDVAVSGVWLALAQRDQFTSVLAATALIAAVTSQADLP